MNQTLVRKIYNRFLFTFGLFHRVLNALKSIHSSVNKCQITRVISLFNFHQISVQLFVKHFLAYNTGCKINYENGAFICLFLLNDIKLKVFMNSYGFKLKFCNVLRKSNCFIALLSN